MIISSDHPDLEANSAQDIHTVSRTHTHTYTHVTNPNACTHSTLPPSQDNNHGAAVLRLNGALV